MKKRRHEDKPLKEAKLTDWFGKVQRGQNNVQQQNNQQQEQNQNPNND